MTSIPHSSINLGLMQALCSLKLMQRAYTGSRLIRYPLVYATSRNIRSWQVCNEATSKGTKRIPYST